jgi:hypothetical protein
MERKAASTPAGGKPGSSPMGVAFETETGNRIYNLPRDHAMHHGDWYKGAEYQETNYFTGFFRDKRTGKPYSVFYCWSVYGWDNKLNRPLWVALFSMTDIERKKFVQCVQPMSGPLTSRGSGTIFLQSPSASGQRVWNTQPDGGLSGDGVSPLSARGARARSTDGSGTGAASKSAFV